MIIYPQNPYKCAFDILVTFLLFTTCFLTPLFLAFPDIYTSGMMYMDQSMNLFFFVDIILNFFTAFFDEDYMIVNDFKKIASMYAKSWFFPDVISILPLELLLDNGNMNKLTRFTRIGKIYKVSRISKLMRLIKTLKTSSKVSKHLTETLKINQGFERATILLLTFFFLNHCTACIWIFIGRMNDDSKDNWIFRREYTDTDSYDLYVTAMYFTVTTVLTVGYGDITAYSVGEKIFCIFLMVVGVISFSFATGTLSSLIASIDERDAAQKEKIVTLNQIKSEYHLDIKIFNKLVRTINYDHSKDD
jgi:hypothetical protein